MIIQGLGLLCLIGFCYALPTSTNTRIVRYDLCLKESNVTLEEIKEFFTARSFTLDTENKGLKCYATCILIQHNVLNNETIRFPPKGRTHIAIEMPQQLDRHQIYEPAPLFSRGCGLNYNDFVADLCEYGFRLYRCLFFSQIMSSNSTHIPH